jgi:hypothetical protein
MSNQIGAEPRLDSGINKEGRQAKRVPTSDREETMKIHRIPKTEILGYCDDCHNRVHIAVTFDHRAPIQLCDLCGRFLIGNVSRAVKHNGKSNEKRIRLGNKFPLEGKSSNQPSYQEGKYETHHNPNSG